MLIKPEEILALLPYKKPFLFADAITKIDENIAEGEYTFKNEFFYKGHFAFKDKEGSINNIPVTPGVILIETMAQIGVVPLGIYLFKKEINIDKLPEFALTSTEAEFYLPVLPGEKVRVKSEKIYFRFGKLKCKVEMKNTNDELICKGIISGMIKNFPSSK